MSALSSDPATVEQPVEDGRHRFWRSATEVLAIVGPTSLLTGILYYFGYVSTKAFYNYFGISLSALNFSASNYLVHSADTFFKPAATLLIVSIVLLIAHQLLRQALSRAGKRWARGVALCLCSLAIVLAGVGLLGLHGWLPGLTSPFSLAASGLLLEYSAWVASRYAVPQPRIDALINTGVNLRRGLIAALVLIATFWTVTDLAYRQGIANARLVEQVLPLESQAVVYSQNDLHLSGPYVGVAVLSGKNTAYHFRYNGLRPLVYANNRWFLLPVGWTHNNGLTVIVLQDDPDRVRVDLAP
jgi:hypothetical protein